MNTRRGFVVVSHWPSWACAIVATSLLANPLHETGHLVGFRLAGIPAAISLNHTYFTKFWAPSFAGAAFGPLMSIAMAWVGVGLLYLTRRLRPLGASLALFMPMTRLVAYTIFALNPRFPMIYNDEGVMGLHTGLRPWTWVFVLLPFLLLPLVLLYQALAWPAWRKLLFIIAGAGMWYVVGVSFEAGVLDPVLFPQAQQHELVMPHAPLPKLISARDR
jgi:hypothetical protein